METDRILRAQNRMAGHCRPAFRFWARPFLLTLALLACGKNPEAQNVSADPDPISGNRLALESSPYLRQHAHNPVDWYPWGAEALEKARKEGKPIFLSIGYSSCYWCHVMERKVFENVEIAGRMNEVFVNIKVDREERPDLDAIYMTATQLLSGHGGWPNSVFLTPDLKPFFAGTYFPPTDQHGRPGFGRVVEAIHTLWTERADEVMAQADEVATRIRRIHELQSASTDLNDRLLRSSVEDLRGRFDETYAGFGGAPKFPPDASLDLLLYVYDRNGDPQVLRMVTRTLDAMQQGGFYDHIGGGFHRYATDARWRVPHFEKMLYNQALLVRAYLRGFVLTGKPAYRKAVTETLQFIRREMTGRSGGFHTSLDAETDGVEGAHYAWTMDEIASVVDPEGFSKIYDLEPTDELAGGIVYRKSNTEDDSIVAKLLAVREQRERPRLDDKIITGWNGLMITALAEAYEVLNEDGYLEAAIAAWSNLETNHLKQDGRLIRSSREGSAGAPAYHEDYAYTIEALLTLFRVTEREVFLGAARRMTAVEVDLFWDEAGGYYFSQGEDVIARRKAIRDSAIPAPNSVSIQNLLTLAQVTDDTTYRSRAGKALRAFGGLLDRSPGSVSRMMVAGDAYLRAAGDQRVPVDVRDVNATRSDSGWRVDMLMDISPGWHIQAREAKPPYHPTSIEPNGDFEIVEVVYPDAHTFDPEFEDDPLPVYSGLERIDLVLEIPQETTRRKLSLSYQACDDTRCLPPATIVVDLERSTIPTIVNSTR